MSDSVRPHRRQPTRLPHPWDSPGKNTGVGCHFLLQCMKVKSESEVAQSFLTLSNPMDCSLPGSSVHGFSRQEYWSGVPLPSATVKHRLSQITVLFMGSLSTLLVLIIWKISVMENISSPYAKMQEITEHKSYFRNVILLKVEICIN